MEALQRGLVGQVLVDVAGRYLGDIVDVQAEPRAGRLDALVVERGPGAREIIAVDGGLFWEHGHWTVVGGVGRQRPQGAGPEAAVAIGEPEDDWMVGHVATRRVLDRRGQVVVEAGQVITAGTVARACRAGVLHLLECGPPNASSRA